MEASLEGLNRVGDIGRSPVGTPRPSTKPAAAGSSFDAVLSRQLGGRRELRFSNHAQQRLQQRQIQLDAAEVAKLERAVDRADQKGVKESLVLLDELALVVNVKNRTVITALPGSKAKEAVFTNIDGVVIA